MPRPGAPISKRRKRHSKHCENGLLKYNFASRFFFAGIGFFIVLALPVLMGAEIASQFYTIIMALNLFSGWFSLSFRQQLYVDIKKSDCEETPPPTIRENVFSKGITVVLLMACVFIMPVVVPEIAGMQGAFLFGIFAAYLLSVSYVSLWYSGKLYFSYAIEACTTIIVFLTILTLGEANFMLGFALVFLFAATIFARVGLRRWLETASGPNTAASQLLSQLIAVASFAEVVFFAGVDLASDIVTYRITLSFVTVISIIFSVIRQWEIFQNTVVPKRWRTRSVFAASVVIMLAGYGAFEIFPPALFVLLLLAALAQFISAPDQFLVIRDNRSPALVFGYILALSLSFGGAYVLGVNDLYSLLLFKVILIGTTSLVPTSAVLIFGIRDRGV